MTNEQECKGCAYDAFAAKVHSGEFQLSGDGYAMWQDAEGPAHDLFCTIDPGFDAWRARIEDRNAVTSESLHPMDRLDYDDERPDDYIMADDDDDSTHDESEVGIDTFGTF